MTEMDSILVTLLSLLFPNNLLSIKTQSIMNNHIVKRSDFTTILTSLFIIITGIILIFLAFPYSKGIGSILVLSGIIILSLCRKRLIYSTTGAKITSYNFYFPLIEKDGIKRMCEKGDFSMLQKGSKEEQGLQMEVYLSLDGKYSAIQLYEYVPHRYERCSPLYEYEGEQSVKFSNYIKTLSV